MPNRLLHETSPYLLQHAHNPVDWYPWGSEALAKARELDRPILLSVGYSACHWCHVMERESFEDEAIAAQMNEHFINIKVDREERPDLDEIYMSAVQAMTGAGGWPMTVFLAPDLRPFYGGTYFPPLDQYGRPGFPRVLQAVAEQFANSRTTVEENAQRLTESLQRNEQLLSSRRDADVLSGPGADLIEGTYRHLEGSFDPNYGGFGGAPKFPNAMGIAVLLRHYRRSGNVRALEIAEVTLKRMAAGGIYDHLGGGFHRYSVDERWLVPHFEKMLYDNALLTWVYLEAYQVTGNEEYRAVVSETLEYVLREMTQSGGGFYSSQDADSEGEEGRFFVWVPEEIKELLGEEQARLFMRYYNVTPEGNFEHGTSILHVGAERGPVSRLLGVDLDELDAAIELGKEKLFMIRQGRVAPGRDEKIIVSWNGLMISAMARAYQVMQQPDFLNAAAQCADFILDEMMVDGQLTHTYKDGRARFSAFQDDYASLIVALLDLYECQQELKWLEAARSLSEQMIGKFWDSKRGGFFYATEDSDDLIVRTKNPFDNATPSGNSLAAMALVRLGVLLDESELKEKARRLFGLYEGLMERAPTSCCQMLCALDFHIDSAYEVALTGPLRERQKFMSVLHERFLPNKVVVGGDESNGSQAEALIPLMKGKIAADRGPTAYLCRDFVCSAPLTETSEFRRVLDEGGSYLDRE